MEQLAAGPGSAAHTTHRAGLGLAIAYNIMQGHNGSIVVDSEPAKGSCVTLTLPRQIAGDPQPSMATAR